MGCAQSKVDNEESVARCKERKLLMKEAVTARNAYAAGHSGFAMSLKNTGAALSDYAHGEAPPQTDDLHQQQQQVSLDHPSSEPRPPPPPPIDNLPPPPPPLPNFSPSPIKRAISLPAMPVKHQRRGLGIESVAEEAEVEEEDEEDGLDHTALKRKNQSSSNHNHNASVLERGPHEPKVGPPPPSAAQNNSDSVVPPMPEAKSMAWDYFFMMDNMPGPSLEPHEEDDNDGNVGIPFGGVDTSEAEIEPKTPERVEEKAEETEEDEVGMERKHIDHSKTAPAELRVPVLGQMKVGPSVPSVDLMKVLGEIDDHFLKASESAQEVAKMLEATRLHYHSNFADNRGHIDHSARVMRVITWNSSFKGVNSSDGAKDELDSEDFETHATVLDKLLAWEKKLYDEVKQGELMKLEYKKKVAALNKLKKRGASAESLEKTKAAVSHLHTRYIVDMQSMDSTVSEVNHIRDKQLYPRLVALVDGMAKMWANLFMHFDSQLKIVTDLKSLDVHHAVKESTRYHHERTEQLFKVVEQWHLEFDKLVTHQKQYIQVLYSWLKLNLIPIESSLKEKISSPLRVQNPPIQALLVSWHDLLEKLPDELAKSAISSFAAVIKTIIHHQDEEMKLKEKCEETRKEFLRRNQAFEEWYQKYMQRKTPTDEVTGDTGEETNPKDPISERQFVVESLKKRLDDEVEAHQRHCLQVREKSLGSLKIRLPELFRAMSDYAHACSDAYEKLRAVMHSQRSNNGHV